MNVRTPVDDLQRYGVGQSVARHEDPVLVRGEGRFADDVSLPGELYAAFVRSPHAHGHLRGVDLSAALAAPGVVGAYAAADLEGLGYRPLPCPVALTNADGSPLRKPRRMALASDRVRYVGDPVALVVAQTAAQARTAAEAVALDIEPLPAAITPEQALRADAPQLYDEAPGNVALDFHFGDAAQVAQAFASAAHVTRLRIVQNRVVVNAMEPRAAVAVFDAGDGRFTMHVASQGVFGMRNNLADAMGVAPDRMRVLTGHVGGSFGMKIAVFPEYVALLHAARALGRPVKWCDARSESFVSDHHGREAAYDAELALDADGRFLATRFVGAGAMGAYLSPFAPMIPTMGIVRNSIGMYRTPLIEARVKCVLTNTSPIGAYRGAGRPEANYMMERLIEAAAAELGLDSVELRRRNLVAPEALPWKTPAGTEYDSGDFPALLAKALEQADWTGFEARRAQSEAAGKLRGRGLGCYLEVTGPPSNEMGGIHFEADGTVTIVTGTLDFGQGHWTAFGQVLTTQLGVPFDKIRLVQGDSDRLIAGAGTGGSKSMMASGVALIEASALVIEKGKALAAHVLEVGVGDIEFAQGRFTIAGTDRSIGVLELADRLRRGPPPPDGLPASLDVDHVIKAGVSAFPNGCHVAEVEIDPETGVVTIARYLMVNDFGVVVNPMLVAGQMHGGVVQGIGQAVFERAVFDEDGQLMTGSYMDYAMPRASDVPFFEIADRGVPARTNALGAKGCGEAGCAGSLPAVVNAIINALAPYGVRDLDMPATPQAIWRLTRAS